MSSKKAIVQYLDAQALAKLGASIFPQARKMRITQWAWRFKVPFLGRGEGQRVILEVGNENGQ